MKGIIYYTCSTHPPKIAEAVRKQLLTIGLPIVSSSLQPLDFGKNIHIKMERGYLAMFTQILACLEASEADTIFFCEADVLYHLAHFEFTPPRRDTFYYDRNWWKIGKGDLAVHWDADQVSGLCCDRDLAIEWYRNRVATFDPDNFDRKFEPMSEDGADWWKADFPHIDIRHNRNLTYNKWTLDHFRKKETAVNFETSTINSIPGWDAEEITAIL